MIKYFNIDCMEYMRQCKDNQFDLAIVDPPYFDGPHDKRVFCLGLIDCSTEFALDKCKECKAWAFNATCEGLGDIND